MKTITRFKRSTKAISPVISVLLMIAVAVVASLVAYAWVMGYMNFQTGKAGHSIVIQSTVADSTGAYVYVQNVGTGTVQIGTVYINNVLVDPMKVTPRLGEPSADIQESETLLLKITGNYSADERLVFKVVTVDGTYMEYTRNP